MLRAKRHNQGVMLRDSEVAIPWKDYDTPLCSNRKTAEDRLGEKHLQPRLEVAEKYCQVIEAKV